MAKSKKDKDLEQLDEELTEVVEDTPEVEEEVVVEDTTDEVVEEVITEDDQVEEETTEEVIEEVVEEDVEEKVEVNEDLEYDDIAKIIRIKPTKSILQSVLIWDGVDEVLEVDNFKRVFVTTGEITEVVVPEGKLEKMLTYYKSLGQLGLVIVE